VCRPVTFNHDSCRNTGTANGSRSRWPTANDAGFEGKVRQGPQGSWGELSVPRHPGQDCQRHGRSEAFTTATRAQEPRYDRALCQTAGRRAGKAASLGGGASCLLPMPSISR
jgi:hypothetical protein